MADNNYKKNIREEIYYLRDHTEKEIIKKLAHDKGIVTIEELEKKYSIEVKSLLDKKIEYDKIPEELIEEYINQSYTMYICNLEIIKVFKELNRLIEKSNSEQKKEYEKIKNQTTLAITNIEQISDPSKEKKRILKKGLKEFTTTLKKQFSPVITNNEGYEENNIPAILLDASSLIALLAAVSSHLSFLDGKNNIISLTEMSQNLRNAGIVMGIFSIPLLIVALYDVGVISKKILEGILEWYSEKKKLPESIEHLKEMGIYNYVISSLEAQAKIDEILSKGKVK